MTKIGIIGTPGGWSSEMLADTVDRKTGYRELIPLSEISLDLETGSAWFGDTDLSKLDALIVKKAGTHYSPALLDRLEMLRFLHERGLKIYSNPFKIMRVLDRLSCTVTLNNGGIPMPPTTITENIEAAIKAVESYGEAVFKPMFSSKARGMVVMRPSEALREDVERFTQEHGIMYIQKKMELGGQDLGVVFLGGEYLTTYARCNDGSSWNTTTRSGGKYKAFTPTNSTIELARKAQALFGLDFTCVDVAETEEGPVIFEVSAFGGFKGIQTACGMDAAELYVDYVLKKVEQP
ncbi:RimK domain protein ATP-grasp [Desulfamplus magnetovallimortis]|uniref:RimK domain protein ATP-grasp n=1 Tax=Desulfamplus magnetovallimortis TaxID=1246637 RepID=A0A1W1HJN3_9BACT|nr:GAK system ATP-grasp enzyme [Desulfamplus magnetovallimortis]SLM32646.1 RimK domain protein ATP-grasp [Desulfamplus magnetovallimortis]